MKICSILSELLPHPLIRLAVVKMTDSDTLSSRKCIRSLPQEKAQHLKYDASIEIASGSRKG